MKTTIAVYTTQKDAVEATSLLKNNGFSEKQISLIWHKKDNRTDAEMLSDKITGLEEAEIGGSVAVGAVLGVLTGIGIFAIPGLGFLYGAGAIVGAFAGFDFGLIGGAVISALSISGMSEKHHEHYENKLKEGAYLLLLKSNEEEAEKAKKLLHTLGAHTGIEIH